MTVIINKTYAGIGSRETPLGLKDIITQIASMLSNEGWLLRSGGAEGADSFFEEAANQKKIYLPWSGFNGKYANNSTHVVPNLKAASIYVDTYHPDPEILTDAVYKLMARNTYQVLGDELSSPVAFVICYTLNGSGKGGTGQAIRIAKDFKIPVHDIGNRQTRDNIINIVKSYL